MSEQPRESTRLVRVSADPPGTEYQPYSETDGWMFRADPEAVADQGARFGRAIRNGIEAIKTGQKVYAEDLGARPRPPMSAQERSQRISGFRGEVEAEPTRLILPTRYGNSPQGPEQLQDSEPDPMAEWEAEMARVQARKAKRTQPEAPTTSQTAPPTPPDPPYGTWQNIPPDNSNVDPEDQSLVDDLNREWRRHYQQEWFAREQERQQYQSTSGGSTYYDATQHVYPSQPNPPYQQNTSYEMNPTVKPVEHTHSVYPTHPEYLNADGLVAKNPCGATTVVRLRNRDHIIVCQEENRTPHEAHPHKGLPHLARLPETMPGDTVFIGWHRDGEES